MADKKKRDAEWAEAKRACRLNAETVRMAKELGLSPRSLMRNIPSKNQQWKAPVHDWIQEMYADMKAKSARKKVSPKGGAAAPGPDVREVRPFDASALRNSTPSSASMESEPNVLDSRLADDEIADFDPLDESNGFEETWFREEPLDDKAVHQQDKAMLRRRDQFRMAAEYVAMALARLSVVRKIVLFGSVAAPPTREVPRFREYRRAGIEVWHECKDVDLAVWIDGDAQLRTLQKARSRALNELMAETGICVAHHQVEIFLMSLGTDSYLGRLCTFGECPKGKPECLVPECGSMKFLQQHANFTLHADALAADRTLLLYDAALPRADNTGCESIPF